MTISGAIFDLDGTLLDSMPMWMSVCTDYIRQNGYEADGISQEFRTMSLTQSSVFIQEHFGLEKSAQQIYDEILAMVDDQFRHTLLLKPDAVTLLKAMREKGIKIALSTASVRYLIDIVLDRFNIRQYFDGVFTCAELGVSKSEPDVFQVALDCLGTPKEETWVFEDSLIAVQTAKKMGLKVAVIDDETNRDTIDEMCGIADLHIPDFKTVLQEVL